MGLQARGRFIEQTRFEWTEGSPFVEMYSDGGEPAQALVDAFLLQHAHAAEIAARIRLYRIERKASCVVPLHAKRKRS